MIEVPEETKIRKLKQKVKEKQNEQKHYEQ